MELLSTKVTSLIFYLALKFPWAFTKRFRFVAESYGCLESEEVSDVYKNEDSIKFASLFDGDVRWKGVSLISAIDRNDVMKIHRWMSNQKGGMGMNYNSHRKDMHSTSLIDAGFSNLGIVTFDSSHMFSVRSVSIVAELPRSCYVTLLRLKNGVSYLSLYISFNESVERRISKIDVGYVRRYQRFRSFNPFSPQFLLLEHFDRRRTIEELVYTNARAVVSEAHQAAAALLQMWGVRKDALDFSVTADFFREGSGSYFDSAVVPEPYKLSSCFTIVSPKRGDLFCSPISTDKTENYIDKYVPERFGVEAIFIKSQVSLDHRRHNQYASSLNGVTDNYAYLLILSAIVAKFERCMSGVSPIFFRNKSSVRENLKILLDANLALNLIDEHLAAVEEGIYWNGAKYREFTQKRLKAVRERVVALRFDVEKRKELNDSELQLTNLFWMKRYSIIVFCLVVVQIVLAVINVDWTEEGRGKNPMYINLFSEKK